MTLNGNNGGAAGGVENKGDLEMEGTMRERGERGGANG